MSPEDSGILAQVCATYASFASYQDQGVVSLFFPDGTAPLRRTFQTAFVRPDLFRFQFFTPHPYEDLRHIVTEEVIGSDGNKVYYYTKRNGKSPHLELGNDLQEEISRANGVSSGAIHNIARLLFPSRGGVSLNDIKVKAIEEDTVEEVPCLTIKGEEPCAWEVAITIEKSSLLLRKLVLCHSGRTTEEVRSQIRVNEIVNSSVFRPPGKRR